MKKMVTMSLLASVALFGQEITSIRYDGLVQLSPTVASEIAEIKVGDEIDAAKINQSIKNLFAQGYFSDIQVEQQGGALVYHIKEKPAVANVNIEGYGSMASDSDEIKKIITIKKGELYDESRAKESKETIVKYLEQKGYYDTVVELVTKPVGKSSVALTYRVNKGEEVTISKINFIGRDKISQSEIENALVNKERDFLGWLPLRNDGKVNADQLKYDAQRVEDVYRQHGYLDVKVEEPLMRVDFGSYSAEVDYKVTEGQQYRVGHVAISQNVKGLKNDALFDEIRLAKGKIFNIQRLRKDMQGLKEAAGNVGYAYAKVYPQIKRNSDATVDVTYVISEGTAVKINDVIISGNNNTKDRVVRRYLYLAPGDTYNAKDLKDSKNSLGRTGFFDNVDVETQKVTDNEVNLLVNVDEASTGSISIGGGYGSYEGAMVNASYSEKNLFGSGIAGKIGFDFSKISNSFDISFTNPKLLDSDYSLSLSFNKKNYDYIDYTEDYLGGRLLIGKEFSRYFHHSVGLGYVDSQSEIRDNSDLTRNVEDNIALSDFYKRFYSDKYQKTSLYYNITFNNTDHYAVAREGMIASLNMEYASLDGDTNDLNLTAGSGEENGYGTFTKIKAKAGVFYGLEDWIDYDLILRAKARYATISSGDGEKLPIAEKLYLGGLGSVRGFESYSLSPRLNDDPESGRIGGKKSASVSLEASIPLSDAAKMRLTGFVDYGMIGEDSLSEIKRSSYGVQIEWLSQFGPLNLVFAKPIKEEKGDRTSVFEFSMGTRF
jgi:outer membrane protein insertion porin family